MVSEQGKDLGASSQSKSSFIVGRAIPRVSRFYHWTWTAVITTAAGGCNAKRAMKTMDVGLMSLGVAQGTGRSFAGLSDTSCNSLCETGNQKQRRQI